MKSGVKWSILVLTQPSREQFLYFLLKVLKPQIEEFSSEVELVVRTCDSMKSIGDNRQIMRESCLGEYSNFIDDDDMVPADYISTILPLMDGVDYIGHNLDRLDDGRFSGTFVHSLDNNEISHINPIRTELALLGSMYGGFGEDRRWWNQLKRLDCVKTQHYISRSMYTYLYRSNKSDGPPKDHFWTDPSYDNS